jgi:glycosyltransferase involved in cell wall biosynthesis
MTASSTPLVSIVIPCYRQAQFLPAAVDSALAQSHPNVEVLVINDGSDDDTEAVARRYGDRLNYVYQPNRGLSAARNTGIAHATGRYLKFLDSDDSLHPDQIAWQAEALGGRDDRVSLTTVRLYQDGRPERFLDHVPEARSLLPDLFKPIGWGGIHGFLFPAKLVRAVGGFDESLRMVEDWNLLTQIGLHDPQLVTDPRVGCYYRLRAGSMSTDRLGMDATRARLLVGLYDTLSARGRPDWFGIDLLRSLQWSYYSLVLKGEKDRKLLDEVLSRIFALQKREGFGGFGWRFRLMARVLGYARAERLRAFVIRLLGRKPKPTLDTEDWRDAK